MSGEVSGTRIRMEVGPLRKSEVLHQGVFYNRPGGGNTWIGPLNRQSFSVPQQPEYGTYTVDEVHRYPFRDTGPFLQLKFHQDFEFNQIYGTGSYFGKDYIDEYRGGYSPPQPWEFGSGPFGTQWCSPTWLDLEHSPWARSLVPSIDSYGRRAWNKAKPKIEQASAFTFAYELRDLPSSYQTTSKGFKDAWVALAAQADLSPRYRRMMLKEKVMSPKRAADHFLNHNFGWAPFIGDLGKFANTYLDSRDHIARLTANNGKERRVRTHVYDDYHEEVLDRFEFPNVMFGLSSGFPQNMTRGPVIKELIESTYTNVWCSGKFSYYLPEFDSDLVTYDNQLIAAKRYLDIYGMRCSPINVYRIIPWTWLIDWGARVSDYVGYVSDVITDNLASSYFVVMMHQKVTRSVRWTIPYYSGEHVIQFNRMIESKQRVPASSPFDFSLSWDGLSPKQLALAVALGITRWG